MLTAFAIYLIQAISSSIYWVVTPENPRYSRIKTFVLTYLVYAVHSALAALSYLKITNVDSLYAHILQSPLYLVARLVLSILIIYLMAYLSSKGTWKRHLKLAAGMLGLTLCTEFAVSALIHGLTILQPVRADELTHVGQTLFVSMMSFLVIMIALFRNRLKIRFYLPVATLIALQTATAVVITVYIWMENPGFSLPYFITTALIVGLVSTLAGYLLYYIVLHLAEVQQAEVELARMKELQKAQTNYYQLVQENQTQISRIRHDLRNQLETVRALLADGQTVGERIIDQMEEQLNASGGKVYCPIPILNAVLNVKEQEAKRGSIAFSAEMELPSHSMDGVTESDQCALLTNLLDNALEGCERAQGRAFIQVKAVLRSGMIVLQVKNSCDPKFRLSEQELPKTSKADKNNHGLGLKILKATAERYGGQCRLRAEDGVFTASVFLPLS